MESGIYKDMYCRLFNRVSEAIEITTDMNVKCMLVKSQNETEEMYIAAEKKSDNIFPLVLK